MNKFRIFKNVKSSTGLSQWSVEKAIAFIKGDRPDLDEVKVLRSHQKGSKQFQLLKEQLPCIIWNFESSEGRKTEDAIRSSGYMYFDIDNATEIDLNPDYVFASWKSISQTGFGVLVRVRGVTLDNFKVCYSDVARVLGIEYDQGTNDLLRLNILSYDENLYYNPTSEVFDYSDLVLDNSLEEEVAEKHQTINQNSYLMSGEWSDHLQPLRFSNIEERMSEKQFVYDENHVCDLKDEKLGYTEVYVPREIVENTRHYKLSIIAIKLFALNRSAGFKQVLSVISSINARVCKPPKSDEEIHHIVKTVFDNRQKLFITANRTKRFFFNNPNLNIAQKRSLVMTYINKERGEKRRKEVMDCMCSINDEGKVFRVSDIVKGCNTSRTTVNSIISFLTEHFPSNIPQLLRIKASKY